VSEASRVELIVLGRTLAIRTDALPDHVRQLAAYLEERVQTVRRAGVRDPVTALTLAALEITDELFRARKDRSQQEGDVGQRLGALRSLLEQVMESGGDPVAPPLDPRGEGRSGGAPAREGP
jgi:cell division protein ZapA (FtsZ GTPase activity inhibitor)